jgi:hypothetical protein
MATMHFKRSNPTVCRVIPNATTEYFDETKRTLNLHEGKSRDYNISQLLPHKSDNYLLQVEFIKQVL